MESLFTRVLAAVTVHVMRNGTTLYIVGSWLIFTSGAEVVNNPQSVSDLFDRDSQYFEKSHCFLNLPELYLNLI